MVPQTPPQILLFAYLLFITIFYQGRNSFRPKEKKMTPYVQPYQLRRMTRRWNGDPQQALRVNVREQEDAHVLSALVPGLQAEDLNIQVLENVVSIEGQYRAEEAELLLNELPSGSFRRTLRLPAEIEAEKVEAKIVGGVLILNLPKAESARPRKIKIAAN
jgi:HSP20 family protein